jgi:hypothetical protein
VINQLERSCYEVSTANHIVRKNDSDHMDHHLLFIKKYLKLSLHPIRVTNWMALSISEKRRDRMTSQKQRSVAVGEDRRM